MYPEVDPQPSFPSRSRPTCLPRGPSATRSRSRFAVAPMPTSSSSTTARRLPTGLPHYGHLLTGLRQGRRAALPDDARQARRATLRLGLPRPSGRGRRREGARHQRPSGDHQVRHRQVQRCLPNQRAALHRRVAALRHPPGPLGRLRQRLQDARPRRTWRASCGRSRPCGTRV